MRTLVDLGDTQVQALDELSKKEKRSRAALIRQAIDDYLVKRQGIREGDVFGLWGRRKVDGLAYQTKVRGEWMHGRQAALRKLLGHQTRPQ